MNFTEGINLFKVDMAEITIADEPCAITLIHEEYGTASRDSLSFTIRLTEVHRSEISKMREPLVRVHPGAFTTLDGMALTPSDVPLNVTGNIPDAVGHTGRLCMGGVECWLGVRQSGGRPAHLDKMGRVSTGTRWPGMHRLSESWRVDGHHPIRLQQHD